MCLQGKVMTIMEFLTKNQDAILKYGSEEKGSSLYKCSILLGFILSKNLRGL